MTIQERFWVGLYLSSGSFWLLWLHKKLLIYLSFLLISFYLIPLFLKNTQLFGLACKESLTYNITFDLGFFVHLYLLTFLLVALIKHTLEIIHGNVAVRVRDIITSTIQLWPQVFLWSLLLTLALFMTCWVTMVSNYLSAPLSLLVNLLVVGLFLAGILGTFLVLPVIAVERIGVFAAIKKSIKLVSIVSIEIIAALFWLGIIAGLGLMVVLMIMNATGNPYVALLLWFVVTIGHYIIHSALGITQALLYQRSTQLLY